MEGTDLRNGATELTERTKGTQTSRVRSGFGRAPRARAGGGTRKNTSSVPFLLLVFFRVSPPALLPAGGRRRNRTSSPLAPVLRF